MRCAFGSLLGSSGILASSTGLSLMAAGSICLRVFSPAHAGSDPGPSAEPSNKGQQQLQQLAFLDSGGTAVSASVGGGVSTQANSFTNSPTLLSTTATTASLAAAAAAVAPPRPPVPAASSSGAAHSAPIAVPGGVGAHAMINAGGAVGSGDRPSGSRPPSLIALRPVSASVRLGATPVTMGFETGSVSAQRAPSLGGSSASSLASIYGDVSGVMPCAACTCPHAACSLEFGMHCVTTYGTMNVPYGMVHMVQRMSPHMVCMGKF